MVSGVFYVDTIGHPLAHFITAEKTGLVPTPGKFSLYQSGYEDSFKFAIGHKICTTYGDSILTGIRPSKICFFQSLA